MKALSIRQPEAWLIVNGYKDIENRTWSTNVRGVVAVHASKARMTRDDWEWLRELCADNGIPVPSASDLGCGGIVGAMKIVDCVTDSDSTWFEGPYGFAVGAAMACDFIPCTGKLGFFDVDIEVNEADLEELRYD
jgi:hypothetical protein